MLDELHSAQYELATEQIKQPCQTPKQSTAPAFPVHPLPPVTSKVKAKPNQPTIVKQLQEKPESPVESRVKKFEPVYAKIQSKRTQIQSAKPVSKSQTIINTEDERSVANGTEQSKVGFDNSEATNP